MTHGKHLSLIPVASEGHVVMGLPLVAEDGSLDDALLR